MVVDIGGGTSEVAVLSMGEIVVEASLRLGGYDLDEAIMAFVRKEHNLAIGQPTAEEVKLAIGAAGPLYPELTAELRGRELVSGLPKTVSLTSEEARVALAEPVQAIVDAVRDTLDRTPPELSSDILTSGILLAGGGALLHGLAQRLHEETQMPTYVADSALTCVAEGAGQALEEFEVIARRHAMRRTHGSRGRGARAAGGSATTSALGAAAQDQEDRGADGGGDPRDHGHRALAHDGERAAGRLVARAGAAARRARAAAAPSGPWSSGSDVSPGAGSAGAPARPPC